MKINNQMSGVGEMLLRTWSRSMTAKRQNDCLTMGVRWLWRPIHSRVTVETFIIHIH